MEDKISYKPSIRYGTSNYVQYHVGGSRSKLIITAPHGGTLRPESIQNRNENKLCIQQGGSYKVNTIMDLYTKEIAIFLRNAIVSMTSEDYAPHLVISDLHRVKMDANRSFGEATLENPEAVVAYNEYHGFICTAKKTVGTGLLVDIHGQSHPEGWVELGYTIRKQDLLTDQLCTNQCSMKSLLTRSEIDIEELIRGTSSLGYFLQNEGIDTIPSPEYPKTTGNYYNGAHSTFRHGSLHGGNIDSIQIETHRKYRTKEVGPQYAKSLASALVKFLKIHYY